MLKQFGDLRPEDFQRHAIWVSAHSLDYDEEWYDETDEETFRPWHGERPVGADEMFLVSASLRFADGTEHEGFVTPTGSDEGLRGMASHQPQVFARSGERFAFWSGGFRDEETERRFYERFAKSPQQVFPIQFQALPGLTSSVASGVVPGFMPLREGEEVVAVNDSHQVTERDGSPDEGTSSQESVYGVLPRWNLILLSAGLVLVIALLALGLYAVATGQLEFFRRYGIPSAMLLVMPLMMLRPFLSLSHSITVRTDSVVFRGLRREWVVRAGTAQSLRPAASPQGAFELRFKGGRVAFVSRFTGFHEVVLALESQNPDIKIEKA